MTPYTVKVVAVAGLGRVLVNGQGRTLYLLSSDRGGKVTCTKANGCAKFWLGTKLPRGVKHGVAGSGARASLLGTTKADGGSLYLTYGRSHWPLYTFAGDTRPGQAKGEGLTGLGGTWYAITRAGTPVMSAVGAAKPAVPPTTTAPPTTSPPTTAPPTTSPPPPPTTSPPTTVPSVIPQGNGGDHDGDNNGAPSDGDGDV